MFQKHTETITSTKWLTIAIFVLAIKTKMLEWMKIILVFFHVCSPINKIKVRYSPHIILCMGLYSNFQINIFNKKSQIVQDNKNIPFLPSLLLSIKEYLSVSWYHIIFQLYLRHQWQILSTNNGVAGVKPVWKWMSPKFDLQSDKWVFSLYENLR